MLYKIARWLYAPKNSTIGPGRGPTLVVPLDYGFLKSNGLPRAALLCMEKAAQVMADAKTGKIAWSSVNYFGPGAKQAHEAKRDVVGEYQLIGAEIVAQVDVSNSIEEAANICVETASNPPKRVILVCDWAHARRARLIWRYYFEDAEILVATIESTWDEAHYSRLQCGKWMWFFTNLGHHALLRILGVERMKNLRHPVMSG